MWNWYVGIIEAINAQMVAAYADGNLSLGSSLSQMLSKLKEDFKKAKDGYLNPNKCPKGCFKTGVRTSMDFFVQKAGAMMKR